MVEIKINIGATFIPGFTNIDIVPWADVQLDLNKDRLPFLDGSVDLVFSYQTLEHIDGYLFALQEIHRVLKHGGRFLVGLPYATSTMYHLVNPYHRHNFNEYSFDFFEIGKLKSSAVEENGILFKKVFHRYHHYLGVFKVVPEPLRSFCRKHLFNVVRFIDFGLFAVKPPHTSIKVHWGERRRLKREFDRCLRARVPYPQEAIVDHRHEAASG
jgi:SAM-dependent methyltransferase